MTFQAAINEHFSGATSEAEFIGASYQALSDYGFNAENTIACVGTCRDEITKSISALIHDSWGEAFSIAGLAGMLFLGKTGLTAANHHAPIEGGKERYVYYVMPHIGIDADGNIGACQRPGRSEPSSACGALLAFQSALQNESVPKHIDFDDLEQSLLSQRLQKAVGSDNVPDLVGLTRLTHRTIIADLEHLISLTVDTKQSDYAIVSGIQIHGPDHTQLVWPGTAYVVQNGQRVELS